jgi:hypothetical protein
MLAHSELKNFAFKEVEKRYFLFGDESYACEPISFSNGHKVGASGSIAVSPWYSCHRTVLYWQSISSLESNSG